MRIVDKLAVPIIILAGGLAYLSEYLHRPNLIPLAVGIFGVFAILLGADTFIQGKIQLFDRLYSRREHYSGLPARLLGIIFFLFGTGIVGYSIMEWLQPGKVGEFLVSLVGSSQGWGILLIAFGFFTLLFGVIRMIAGSAHGQEERRALVDFWFRFWGLIGTVVGILLLILGVWLAFK